MAIKNYEIAESSGEVDSRTLQAIDSLADPEVPVEERGVVQLHIRPAPGDLPSNEAESELRIRTHSFKTRPAAGGIQTRLLRVLGVTLDLPHSNVNIVLAANPDDPATLSFVVPDQR